MIEGQHADTPHSDRRIEVVIMEGEIDDVKLFVILHNMFGVIRDGLRDIFGQEKLNDVKQMFIDYHLGEHSNMVVDCKIEIEGTFVEENEPIWQPVFSFNSRTALKPKSLLVILYEILCNLRNQISKTTSREEMQLMAKKYNIFDFGMMAGEEPFVTRD